MAHRFTVKYLNSYFWPEVRESLELLDILEPLMSTMLSNTLSLSWKVSNYLRSLIE